ncbi:MAG: ATP-binding cassette domain-containing protein, partial [Limisphaerales bacterium]
MTQAPPVLTVSNLDAAYEGSQVLRRVSLIVPQRQVVTLMGRNGVGKTTALKCLMGLVKPTCGEIRLGELPLDKLPPDQRARTGFGYVPQGRDIFPNLTVWENLQISLVANAKKANGEVD